MADRLIDWTSPEAIDQQAHMAIQAKKNGDTHMATMLILFPGVLERVSELEDPNNIPSNIILGEE